MAASYNIITFILKWEGDYGNDPDDAGGETRKGITWKTWQSVFGDTHDRFMAMSDDDWGQVFKKLFWDPLHGDEIASRKVAEMMVDWMWCSGKKIPGRLLQTILVQNFGCQIDIDSVIGKQTIMAINSVDAEKLFNLLTEERMDYLEDIVVARPQNKKFLSGWKNRVNALVEISSAHA